MDIGYAVNYNLFAFMLVCFASFFGGMVYAFNRKIFLILTGAILLMYICLIFYALTILETLDVDYRLIFGWLVGGFFAYRIFLLGQYFYLKNIVEHRKDKVERLKSEIFGKRVN